MAADRSDRGRRPVAGGAIRGGVIGAVVALLIALPAGAQAPMSAIDWLSESVRTPAPPPAKVVPPTGSPLEAIDVSVIGLGNLDAAGLYPGAITGLPRDIWGTSRSADLIALIASERADAVPALRTLFLALLAAELDPPADAGNDGDFLLARIDKMLDLGEVQMAADLAAAAGAGTALGNAGVFRRRFDAALLLGTEDTACAELRSTPGIAPTFPARVFCLARGGDFQAASLTLDTALALGQVREEDEALLARFLDPELAEEAERLPPPAHPTPLTLRLHEAIGEPLSTASLPLAFAHADLRSTTGWKGQIDAAERLARAGALAPARLHALYTERRAAASGGVWDRVAAVQALDAALAGGDATAVARALEGAWAAMTAADLEVPFAEHYTPRLTPYGGALAFRIALLSPDYAEVALRHTPSGAQEVFLTALARGAVAGVPAPDSMSRLILPVFAPNAPPLSAGFESMIATGRRGEAILVAMDRVAAGATGDRRDVADGLALLRAVGLEDTARRAALQILLLERRG